MSDIIIVAGHAGSGKTEFAKQLASRTEWTLLDKDTLSRPFVEALAKHMTGDPNDRHSSTYLHHIRPLEYKALLETMWEVLDSGVPGVVVTAPFAKELFDPEWINNFNSKCEQKGTRLTLVWVRCNSETLKTRISNRNASRDGWKLQNWTEWVESLTIPPLRENDIHIDNSNDSISLLGPSVEAVLVKLTATRQQS